MTRTKEEGAGIIHGLPGVANSMAIRAQGYLATLFKKILHINIAGQQRFKRTARRINRIINVNGDRVEARLSHLTSIVNLYRAMNHTGAYIPRG